VSDTVDHLEALAAQACPDGGWGYAPGQEAHLEPTCLALLALAAERERFAAAVEAGRNWLERCAAGDGTYRLGRGRPEAAWPTALVLFTRAVLGDSQESLNPTAAALLGRKGLQAEPRDDEDVNDIDVKLVGWPWAEGNFSWVEPTAWACLALRKVGQGEHPRVKQGLELLLDRALESGGANYGNRRIFGVELEPIPGPTALLLLALQGRPEHPRVRSAVAYLRDRAPAGDDLEHLCWARLALHVYTDHPEVRDVLPALGERIRAAHRARADTPWLRPAPLRQALTALALNVERGNPFRLPTEQPSQTLLMPREPLLRKRSLGERIRAKFQALAVEAATQLRQPGPRAGVHVAPVGDYNADLADVLRRQYECFRD
jgi:hypothetical protein